MLDVVLVSLLFLVMVPGLIIYDKQMEKYYKKHCILKVEAHIVERKRITGPKEEAHFYFLKPFLGLFLLLILKVQNT